MNLSDDLLRDTEKQEAINNETKVINEITKLIINENINKNDDQGDKLTPNNYNECVSLREMLRKQEILNKQLQFDLQKMRQILSIYNSLGSQSFDFTPDAVTSMHNQNVLDNMNRSLPTPAPSERRVEKNPHVDKTLLTRADIIDIIAWALDDIDIASDVYAGVRDERVKGKPDSIASVIAGKLAELVYGYNNYIGPEKTGNVEGTLEEILTTVPAITPEDAMARAHDTGLVVSDLPHIDAVLPPLAEAAQVLQPFFVSKPMGRGSKISVSNRDLLKLAGDVEENPGPDVIVEYAIRGGGQTVLLGTYDPSVFSVESRVNYYIGTCICETVFEIKQSRYKKLFMLLGFDEEDDTIAIVLMPKEDLTKCGDIEANPGPKEGVARIPKLNPFTEDTGHTLLDSILQNPTAAASYVNTSVGASFYANKSHLENRANVTMRSGSDNSTDYALGDCNWAQLGGYCTFAAGPNGIASRHATRMSSYSWSNRVPRADKIAYGELGNGLGKSLVSFPDFTSAQRTNTNAVSGDALLQLYSRTPTTDYGDYINLAKLLCYASFCSRFVMSGTVMDCYFPDMKTNAYDFTAQQIAGLWPGSNNEANLALTPIEAYAITQETYASLMLGNINAPFIGMDESNTAFIPIDASWPSETIALITMCHLEFPFFQLDNTTNGLNVVVNSVANGVANSPSYNAPIWIVHSLIRGPKYQVVYILTSNDPAPVRVYNTDVQVFDPYVILPPTNIVVPLTQYVNQSLLTNNPNPFFSAFDYFSRFATMGDYKAACLFAGALMQRKVPYYTHQIIGGAATPVPQGGGIVPTFNANIATRSIGTIAGRTQEFSVAITKIPTYTQYLGVDYPSTGQAPGGGVRPDVPDTATYQNNTHLTRYGVYIGILKKNVIAGSTIDNLFKGNTLSMMYAIWQASDVCVDMMGEWLIENGVTNHMLHYQPAVAVSKRNMIWKKVASLWKKWQTKYTGLPYYRLSMPGYAAVQAGDLANYFTMSAWYQAPLLITNRHLFDNFMDFDFAPTVRLVNTTQGVFEYSSNVQALIGPTNSIMGGQGALTAIKTVMYETKKDKLGNEYDIMRLPFKNIFAQSITQHLANANVYARWCSANMRERQNAINHLFCPSFMYFSDWLRVFNTIQPIDMTAYSSGNRPILGMSLPCYPPDYAPSSGHQLLLQITQDADANGPRPMISLDGSGTYLYGTVKGSSNSSAFEADDDPF